MTGVWINTDLMSFMKVPGGQMWRLGITYFHDTVKDKEIKNLCSKSIKCIRALICTPVNDMDTTLKHHTTTFTTV